MSGEEKINPNGNLEEKMMFCRGVVFILQN